MSDDAADPAESAVPYESDCSSRVALAYHVAGHHWGAWLRGGSAGAAAVTPMVDHGRQVHPAHILGSDGAAVLTQSLARAGVMELIDLQPADLDDPSAPASTTVSFDVPDGQCGCKKRWVYVSRLVNDHRWPARHLRLVMRDWHRIGTLADLLLDAHVLEADEVAEVLTVPASW